MLEPSVNKFRTSPTSSRIFGEITTFLDISSTSIIGTPAFKSKETVLLNREKSIKLTKLFIKGSFIKIKKKNLLTFETVNSQNVNRPETAKPKTKKFRFLLKKTLEFRINADYAGSFILRSKKTSAIWGKEKANI